MVQWKKSCMHPVWHKGFPARISQPQCFRSIDEKLNRRTIDGGPESPPQDAVVQSSGKMEKF